MAELIASYIVYASYGYTMVGVLFAVVFVWRGVERVDHQVKGSGLGFRALIFPGCVAFWPQCCGADGRRVCR